MILWCDFNLTALQLLILTSDQITSLHSRIYYQKLVRKIS